MSSFFDIMGSRRDLLPYCVSWWCVSAFLAVYDIYRNKDRYYSLSEKECRYERVHLGGACSIFYIFSTALVDGVASSYLLATKENVGTLSLSAIGICGRSGLCPSAWLLRGVCHALFSFACISCVGWLAELVAGGAYFAWVWPALLEGAFSWFPLSGSALYPYTVFLL